MPHHTVPRSRDDVLLAFQAAHPRPRAEDVEAWIGQHPAHADDIRAHAGLLLLAHRDGPERAPPSPELVARARDRALARLEAARAAVATATTNLGGAIRRPKGDPM